MSPDYSKVHWPDMSKTSLKMGKTEKKKLLEWFKQIHLQTNQGIGKDPLVPFEGDTADIQARPTFVGHMQMGFIRDGILAIGLHFKIEEMVGVGFSGEPLTIQVPKHLQNFCIIKEGPVEIKKKD